MLSAVGAGGAEGISSVCEAAVVTGEAVFSGTEVQPGHKSIAAAQSTPVIFTVRFIAGLLKELFIA